MAAKFLVILLTLFAVSVTADIKITQPSSTNYAVINSTCKITWDYSGSVPDVISIKLQDNRSTNKSFSGNLGIGQARTSDKSYDWVVDISRQPGDNYNIIFMNGSDLSGNESALATSDQFSIKPAGTPPPSDDKQNSTSSTTSGTAPSSTSTGGPNKTNSATSLIGSTTLILGLVIITVFNNIGL